MRHVITQGGRHCAIVLFLGVLTVGTAFGQSRTYTTDSDFDEGVLSNVNHNAPNNDQLQLNEGTAAFPFVNVAASQRGTVVRAHTETGDIVGEYFSAPNGMGRNPSRTTVDQFGSAWVGNRNEAGFVPSAGQIKGSLTRIGLVVGGTRTDAAGNPDPTGQFILGPAYSTCVDRHGATVADPADGLIKTSKGLGDILPWSNAASADQFGGVSTAEDECIINYTRAGSPNTRTITIDKNNDVWVGGTGNRQHEKVDGVTGVPVPGTTFVFGCGGYGGFIDGNGVLWSMTSGASYLRYDTNTNTGACLSLTNYGTGVDPNTGEIWITQLNGNLVHKVAPDGTLLGSFPHGNAWAQGVVVDNDGNVWVAHSLVSATTVGHLKTDGTYIGNVPLPGGLGPTGVAVDAAGKVWVANINSNNAMRIDPDAGPLGADGVTPVGAVDLTVSLGAGAGPYNYSDMTGSVVAGVTAPQGTWTVVYDGGSSGVNWDLVSWNSNEPLGTSITTRVRAADSEAGLSGVAYSSVTDGVSFGGTGITGRFIQIQTTLSRDPSVQDSPILFDLTVSATGECVATTLSGPVYGSSGGLGTADITFTNSDGLEEIAFTSLNNLSVAAPSGWHSIGGNAFEPDGAPPSSVTFRLTQVDPGNPSASYFATAYSTCPSEADGRLETVFDPPLSMNTATSIETTELPDRVTLQEAYPNPFNPQTTIRFGLPTAMDAFAEVYDITGRQVAVLMSGERLAAGWHELTFEAGDLPSGLYLMRLHAGSTLETARIMLVK